jgi:hypothetical protein
LTCSNRYEILVETKHSPFKQKRSASIDRMPKLSRKHASYSKIFDPGDHDEDPTSLKEREQIDQL